MLHNSNHIVHYYYSVQLESPVNPSDCRMDPSLVVTFMSYLYCKLQICLCTSAFQLECFQPVAEMKISFLATDRHCICITAGAPLRMKQANCIPECLNEIIKLHVGRNCIKDISQKILLDLCVQFWSPFQKIDLLGKERQQQPNATKTRGIEHICKAWPSPGSSIFIQKGGGLEGLLLVSKMLKCFCEALSVSGATTVNAS